MIEPILTLASSVITLVTPVCGIFQDKKSLDNKQENSNNQVQKFSDISTNGNNSSINIMATQIQESTLVKNHQKEIIEEQIFRENLGRLVAYNKSFLIICPVICIVLFCMKKIDSLTQTLGFCIVIVSSFSLSLYFRYIFHRYVRKIKNCGREKDIMSRNIRAIEFLIFPILLFTVSLLSIIFSIVKYPSEIDEKNISLFLAGVYIVSAYVESTLFQFVVGGNIWTISAFLKRFFCVLFLLFIAVLVLIS